MKTKRTRDEEIKNERLRNQGREIKKLRMSDEIMDVTRRDQGQTMKKSRTRHEDFKDKP